MKRCSSITDESEPSNRINSLVDTFMADTEAVKDIDFLCP
jgi:hypothetical protein